MQIFIGNFKQLTWVGVGGGGYRDGNTTRSLEKRGEDIPIGEGGYTSVCVCVRMGWNNVNSAKEDREEAASQSLTCDELRH